MKLLCFFSILSIIQGALAQTNVNLDQKFATALQEYKDAVARETEMPGEPLGRLLIFVHDHPEYWDRFRENFKADDLVTEYTTSEGKIQSYTEYCNIGDMLRKIPRRERKAAFDKISYRLQLLNADLSSKCHSETLFDSLRTALEDKSEVKVERTPEDKPRSQTQIELDLYEQAQKPKEKCQWFHRDDDKDFTLWAGEPTATGLYQCGECKQSIAQKNKLFKTARQIEFANLKDPNVNKSGTAIFMMKPIEIDSKTEPKCKSYFFSRNDKGENRVRFMISQEINSSAYGNRELLNFMKDQLKSSGR